MTVLGTAKPPVLGTEKPLVLGTRKPRYRDIFAIVIEHPRDDDPLGWG